MHVFMNSVRMLSTDINNIHKHLAECPSLDGWMMAQVQAKFISRYWKFETIWVDEHSQSLLTAAAMCENMKIDIENVNKIENKYFQFEKNIEEADLWLATIKQNSESVWDLVHSTNSSLYIGTNVSCGAFVAHKMKKWDAVEEKMRTLTDKPYKALPKVNEGELLVSSNKGFIDQHGFNIDRW